MWVGQTQTETVPFISHKYISCKRHAVLFLRKYKRVCLSFSATCPHIKQRAQSITRGDAVLVRNLPQMHACLICVQWSRRDSCREHKRSQVVSTWRNSAHFTMLEQRERGRERLRQQRTYPLLFSGCFNMEKETFNCRSKANRHGIRCAIVGFEEYLCVEQALTFSHWIEYFIRCWEERIYLSITAWFHA